jgi:predicted RNA methylase
VNLFTGLQVQDADLNRVQQAVADAFRRVAVLFGSITRAPTPVRTVSAAYTLQDIDGLVLVDATAGALTVKLPSAVGRAGLELAVKKIDASVNAVTVNGSGTNVDGAASVSLGTQFKARVFVSDGVAWWAKAGVG